MERHIIATSSDATDTDGREPDADADAELSTLKPLDAFLPP